MGPLHHHGLTLAECLISTDQRVKGDCCQSESDPATCFLCDPENIFKYFQHTTGYIVP